jgi:hypothetical protein
VNATLLQQAASRVDRHVESLKAIQESCEEAFDAVVLKGARGVEICITPLQ